MQTEFGKVGESNFCVNSIQILLSGSDRRFVQYIIRQNFEGCCNQGEQLAHQRLFGKQENELQYNDDSNQNDIRMCQGNDQQQAQSETIIVDQTNFKGYCFEFSTNNNENIKMFGDIDQNNEEYFQNNSNPREEQYQDYCSRNDSSEQQYHDQDSNDSNYSFEQHPDSNQNQPAFIVQIDGQDPHNFSFETATDIFGFTTDIFEGFYPPDNYRVQGLSQNQMNQIQQIELPHQTLLQGSQKCSICIQDIQIGDKVMVLECKHKYHSNCLKIWLKDRSLCPNCRHSLKCIGK